MEKYLIFKAFRLGRNVHTSQSQCAISKNPDYNFYRVAGMAIGGKPKGSAQNEAEPINVKSLLP